MSRLGKKWRERFSDGDVPNTEATMFGALKKAQLSLPRRQPGIEPVIPADITQLADDEVGRIYCEFASMVTYVTSLVAVANVQVAEKRLAADRARARAMFSASGKNYERNAIVELDPRVVSLENAALEAEAMRSAFKMQLDVFSTGKEAMSREISRRKDLFERRTM